MTCSACSVGEDADGEPKAPDGYDDCDQAKDPEQCRKLFEAVWCLRNPNDPWCKRQREKREDKRAKDRALLAFVGGIVVGGWVLNKWHTRGR